MEESGIRFHGNLDPRAAEFRPENCLSVPVPSHEPNPFALISPPVYYTYPPGFSPALTFYDNTVPYHHRQPPPPSCFRSSSSLPNPAATRTLMLSSVPSHVTETMIRRELEIFGDVREVQMERLFEGIVTVHFYDIRVAEEAITAIQEQHMLQQSRLGRHYSMIMNNWRGDCPNLSVPSPPAARGLIGGQAVWAQFVSPSTISAVDGQNQGTLVVFNLSPEITTSMLKEIFEVYGSVKELRETPSKRHHRFIEFFDIRDGARALSEMNGKEIMGKRIIVEYSRPGGQNRRLFHINSSNKSSKYTKNTHQQQSSQQQSLPPRLLSSSAHTQESCQLEGKQEHVSKKNPRKVIHNPSSNPQSKHLSRRGSSSSSSKNNKKQADTTFFLFNEDAIENPNRRDNRTTVMIKNIPNKYSQELLLNMLDNHCIHCNEQISAGEDEEPLSAYDFVYLPIDFNNKCNVGYGFVNFTSPNATWRLYKAFHLQPWEVFNSRKICEVTYARLQGLDALKEHFKSSKLTCDTDEYLPVIFCPPRDGKQLSAPIPICGSISHGGGWSNKILTRQERSNSDVVYRRGHTDSISINSEAGDDEHSQVSDVLLDDCFDGGATTATSIDYSVSIEQLSSNFSFAHVSN